MKKSAITLLVFSLIFVTLTVVLLFFTALFVGASLSALYKPDNNAGDVLGGIILFIAMIPYCLGTIASAGAILPFNLVMRFRMKVKTWYTLVIFIFAIAAAVTAVVLLITVPVISSITDASRASSSSSNGN